GANARFVNRMRIVGCSTARGLPGRDRVELGGGLFQADELRPRALTATHVRPIEIGGRRRRTLGDAEELHLRLGERAPTLLVIARAARRDHVLPGVLAAAVPRHHVVEREVVAALPAVLAGVVIPLESLLA